MHQQGDKFFIELFIALYDNDNQVLNSWFANTNMIPEDAIFCMR